jgi:sugar-specific transcriptional regulator TrmB
MTWAAHPRLGIVEVVDESPNLVRIVHPENPDERFWVRKNELDELIEVGKLAA